MIAGLLQSDAVEGMAGLPGIRKTPILGDLISSNSFERNETELVVMISAYLVEPFADKFPNRFINDMICNKSLPILKQYNIIRPEVTVENHRIDFLLENASGSKFYLEVKSVTYVKQGIAKFPDAVTLRGTNHVKLLTKLKKADIDTGIIFVCQRPDAELFTPMKERDKSFFEALKHAKNFGVKIWCITLNVGLKEINYIKQIPVKFDN